MTTTPTTGSTETPPPRRGWGAGRIALVVVGSVLALLGAGLLAGGCGLLWADQTQRDDDGLALSSRNIYLDTDERARAVALPRALGEAARGIARGDDPATAIAAAQAMLTRAGFAIDYVALVDADSFGDPIRGRPARLLAAIEAEVAEETARVSAPPAPPRR